MRITKIELYLVNSNNIHESNRFLENGLSYLCLSIIVIKLIKSSYIKIQILLMSKNYKI